MTELITNLFADTESGVKCGRRIVIDIVITLFITYMDLTVGRLS